MMRMTAVGGLVLAGLSLSLASCTSSNPSSCETNQDCSRSGTAQVCCNGNCIDPAKDSQNCGNCGRVCPPLLNAKVACTRGFCGLSSCRTGFGDCDGNAGTGCETDLASDLKNCGGCGFACTAGAHQSAACAAGSCTLTCAPGWSHCSADPADGCEVHTEVALANCGGCGNACGPLANATAACVAGSCAIASCFAGFGDCDGLVQDGCEDNLSTDSKNCGACGEPCAAVQNGTLGCVDGSCSGVACDPGFADCNGLPADGCETNLAMDAKNCGKCGHSCRGPESTQACQMRACAVTACSHGYADCDRMAADGCEVATGSDVTNCGGCGNICPAPLHAVAGCTNGMCGIGMCNAGFADCDKMPGDGCEVNIEGDVKNCGACANACTPPNATPACAMGNCAIGMCNMGFADCDAMLPNGCEVNTQTDASNCGACGKACMVPNASPKCAGGICAIGMCNAGFADCDMMVANGCEAKLESDQNNCGMCGIACVNPKPQCVLGKCMAAISCQAIKLAYPKAADGIYTVDPDGPGGVAAFEVWCDMTLDGGGWTLWASVVKDSPQSAATITPASAAYMDPTRYGVLHAVSSTFRARGQTTGVTYFLSKDQAAKATCHNLSSPVPESVDVGRGWTTVFGHTEGSGCDLTGLDYAYLAAWDGGQLAVYGGFYKLGIGTGITLWHKDSPVGTTELNELTVEARVELYLQ